MYFICTTLLFDNQTKNNFATFKKAFKPQK